LRSLLSFYYDIVSVDLFKEYLNMVTYRPLKIRTDGSHSRVRELGSIGIFSIFAITFSKVLRVLV